MRRGSALRDRLAADGITNLVETFDPERYNTNASVAENLLFGTPIGPVFDFEALADNQYVRAVLDKLGLTEDLIEAGRQIAATMTEMFAGLPPDHEFFDQFSFISSQELPEYAAILSAADTGGVAGLHQHQREKLLSLPFRLSRRAIGSTFSTKQCSSGCSKRGAYSGATCRRRRRARSSSSIPSAITPRHRCRTTFFSARSPMARRMRRCGSRR